jgi:hypothetical protein
MAIMMFTVFDLSYSKAALTVATKIDANSNSSRESTMGVVLCGRMGARPGAH